MIQLFHYTCAHGLAQIEESDWVVKPNPQTVLGRMPLAWFTTASIVDRKALGLTSLMLRCDRGEFRLRVVEGDTVVRWNDVRHLYPTHAVSRLEAARGTRPALWWVSTEPVKVEPA